MARCYILASMSNVLQHQHERMLTAYDIMLNLKEIFGEQSHAGRKVAMRALPNTKMAKGTSVGDHVLKMIGHLNELEILGAKIDSESQVDMVLMSLPESLKNFHLNYFMSKESYSLAELLKELQATEGIIGQNKNVQVAEKGSSSKKSKNKKRLRNRVQCPRLRSQRMVKASASLVVKKETRRRIA